MRFHDTNLNNLFTQCWNEADFQDVNFLSSGVVMYTLVLPDGSSQPVILQEHLIEDNNAACTVPAVTVTVKVGTADLDHLGKVLLLLASEAPEYPTFQTFIRADDDGKFMLCLKKTVELEKLDLRIFANMVLYLPMFAVVKVRAKYFQ